jgi:hypothetical protein
MAALFLNIYKEAVEDALIDVFVLYQLLLS